MSQLGATLCEEDGLLMRAVEAQRFQHVQSKNVEGERKQFFASWRSGARSFVLLDQQGNARIFTQRSQPRSRRQGLRQMIAHL